MASRKAGSRRSQPKSSYGALAATILERWRGAGDEVPLDRIVAELSDVARYDVVAALKELEKAGAGEFFVGRFGQKARFVWKRRAAEAARQAGSSPRANAPADQLTPPKAARKLPDTAPRTLEHVFHLRPGYSATLRLPVDVTPTEIERLCRFLKAIPFNAARTPEA